MTNITAIRGFVHILIEVVTSNACAREVNSVEIFSVSFIED